MDLVSISASLQDTFQQLAAKIIQNLPSVIGALLLLIFGWVVARLLRSLTVSLFRGLELIFNRRGQHTTAPQHEVSVTSSNVVSNIVFWTVILFFISAASRLLEFELFSNWISVAISFVPSILAGGLILFTGYVVSSVAKDLLMASSLIQPQHRSIAGKFVQGLIVTTTLLIGLNQVGIDVTFLMILFVVLTASVIGGLTLAASIGVKSTVSNFIGAHYVKQTYKAGQRLRIGDYEGTIVELGEVAVTIETKSGIVNLPAKMFQEMPSTLMIEAVHDDKK